MESKRCSTVRSGRPRGVIPPSSQAPLRSEAVTESLSRQVEALSRQLELERDRHAEFVRSIRQRRAYVIFRLLDSVARLLSPRASQRVRRRTEGRRIGPTAGPRVPSPADLVNRLAGGPPRLEPQVAPGSVEAALIHLRDAVAAGYDDVAVFVTRTILHAYPGVVTADFAAALSQEMRSRDLLRMSRVIAVMGCERWPNHIGIALESAIATDDDADPSLVRSRWLAVAALVAPETSPGITARVRQRLSELDTEETAGDVPSERPLDPMIVEDYQEWIARSEDHGPQAHRRWRRIFGEPGDGPLVTLVMPTYRPDPGLLAEALESVLAQWYTKWQLVICDDGSDDGWMEQPTLRSFLGDPRIELLQRAENCGIVAASNQALDAARGAWVGFIDQDDLLPVDALARVMTCSQQDTRLRLIYTDEDALLADGRRAHPFFKPNSVRELLLGQNVINHLAVYERRLMAELGGLRENLDGAQDWDLNLRAMEILGDDEVGHVEGIGYHWRQHESSFSQSRSSVAHRAGARAVADALHRRGLSGALEAVAHGGYFRPVLRAPAPPPSVSVIMPTRDHPELIRESIGSLLSITAYPDFEVLLIDNGTRETEARELLTRFALNPRVSIVVKDEPFNFARLVNAGARRSTSDVLVLLNNDVIVQRPDWLHQLAAHAVRPDIGAVGARLLFPDRTVQHAGVVLGPGGVAGHFPSRLAAEDPGYFGQAVLNRDVEAVTGAVMATRRDVYWGAGGFDETLAVAFNDVDFCLKLRRMGYRNIVVASTEFIHLESASRGSDASGPSSERLRSEAVTMIRRWGDGNGMLVDGVQNRFLGWSGSLARPSLNDEAREASEDHRRTREPESSGAPVIATCPEEQARGGASHSPMRSSAAHRLAPG